MMPSMDGLRKAQKKKLTKRIGEYVRKKLIYMLDIEEWDGVEIADEFKFPSNRQSEIKDPVKYSNGGLTVGLLETLIERRFVTVDEIVENVAMDDAEKEYVESFRIFENQLLREYGVKLIKKGVDPGKLLEEAYKKLHPEE